MNISGEITARSLLWTLCLAVVLGPLTTVAVAWALAAWLPHRNLQKQFDSIWPERKEAWAMVWVREYRRAGMARRLFVAASASMNRDPNVGSTFDQRLSERGHEGRWAWRDWGALEKFVREVDPTVTTFGADDSRGWPWRAMWCEIDKSPVGATTRLWEARGGAIVMGKNDADIAMVRVLPWRVMWGGFVLDWCVYSAGWLAGLVGLAWGVGAWRRRRGRCLRCGYDLAGMSGARCPECGRNGEASQPAHA